MHNPIKGAINIEIGGQSYPLIFTYDAIAKIEAEYDASLLDVQFDMSRIEKMFSFLEAALDGAFTLEELKAAFKEQKLPSLEIIVISLKEALNVAYFGGEIPEDEETPPEDAKKKKWYCLWLA